RRLAVEEGLQLLAHLEVGDLFGRYVDLLPRLRVAALSRRAISEAEAAESPDLDFLAVLQRVYDAFERRFHDDPCLDLRDLQLSGDDVDEIGLGHGVTGLVIHRERSGQGGATQRSLARRSAEVKEPLEDPSRPRWGADRDGRLHEAPG